MKYGDASIETVRESAVRTKEAILAYANRSIEEKLGPEYELDAKIVERIVSTTLEFHLFKNGIIQEEADQGKSIDGESLIDEIFRLFRKKRSRRYDFSIIPRKDDRKSGLCPDTPQADARARSKTVVDFLMKINNLYNEVKNKPEDGAEDNVISVNCS